MFKRLKEKIEEVKSSPQRIQQLTQSVSDRLQNSSVSEENFFSLGDDDASVTNSTLEPGFTNVSLTSSESRIRRNSNSSVASDVSFLPRYESSPNMYHLQSDLDVSASEIEDNASTSSQLGNISKEQVYSAFQKAQMRYHKYRGRYTDLAKHYRELERENAKMKSVLVETQDKAIRRVAELREQCNLEQKAKAHLENALRVELDEKQYKIETLQTQISLLQNTTKQNDTLADSDLKQSENANLELLTKYLNDARAEIENLNEKIQEMKANTIIFQSKETDYKTKIANLERELAQLCEREKENNLKLAENKMELHNEILVKDSEISNLKAELENVKRKHLDEENDKPKDSLHENLQSQNAKLIEKVESLTRKCNKYESDLLKMEQYKIEIINLNESVANWTSENSKLEKELAEVRQKLEETLREMESKEKELEEKINQQREEAKTGLLSLERKVREKLGKEYEIKEEELKTEFLQKIDSLTSNEDHLKETQLKLFEKEDLLRQLEQEKEEVEDNLQLARNKYRELEENHLELINEASEQRREIADLNKQISDLRETNKRLEEESTKLNTIVLDNAKHASIYDDLQKEFNEKQNETLSLYDKIQDLETEIKKLMSNKEEFESLKQKHDEMTSEKMAIEKLVKSLEQNISKEKEISENLEEELARVKTENEEFRNTIAELERQIEESNLTNKLQLQTYESELSLKNDQLKNLETKMQELEEKCAENETLLSSRSQNLQELEEKYLDAIDQNQNLKEQILEIDELHAKITELHAFEVNYKKVLEDNKQLLYDAEVLHARLDQHAADMERLKQEKSNELEKLSLEISAGTKELKTTKDNLKSAEGENENLRREIATLQAKIAQLKDFESKYNDAVVQNEELKQKQMVNQAETEEIKRRNSQITLDNKMVNEENSHLLHELEELKIKLDTLHTEYNAIGEKESKMVEEKQKLSLEMDELKSNVERLKKENSELKKERALRTTLEDKSTQNQLVLQETKTQLENLVAENSELKNFVQSVERNYQSLVKEKTGLETQIRQLENQYGELQHEKQLLQDEIQELKTSPVNLNHNRNIPASETKFTMTNNSTADQIDEMKSLHEKLIQYQSLELTTRSSLEFYHNEVEKLKLKNEKLNRELDETIVSLNHCADLTNSTEIEYLRNVLYNYMLGKESMVLARVIAAVCKFDEQQTEAILQKEQQKQTLLGQLGIL